MQAGGQCRQVNVAPFVNGGVFCKTYCSCEGKLEAALMDTSRIIMLLLSELPGQP